MRLLVHRTQLSLTSRILLGRHPAAAAAAAASSSSSSSSSCPCLPRAASASSSGRPPLPDFLAQQNQRRGFASGPAVIVDDLSPPLPPFPSPEVSSSSRPADAAAAHDDETRPGGSPKRRRRKKSTPTSEAASDVKTPTGVSIDTSSKQKLSSRRRRRESAASPPSPDSSAVPSPPPSPPPPPHPPSPRRQTGKVNKEAAVTAADAVSDPNLLQKKKKHKEKKEKKEKKLPPPNRSPAAVTARQMADWEKEHVPSLAAAEQLVEGVRQHLSYRYYPLKVFLDHVPDTVTARDLFQIFAGLGGIGEVEAVVVLEAMRAKGRRQRADDLRETGPRTAIIQLGDKATYDRALSDDVRMFGICWQRHVYKPTRGLGRNLFFTLSSGEYTVQDMTGKGLSVPPPPPLEELSLSFFEEGRECGDEEGEEGGTAQF